MKNSVLTVRDNEHNVFGIVGDNEVACQKLPESGKQLLSLGNAWENPMGGTSGLIWLYFPRGYMVSDMIVSIYNSITVYLNSTY